MIIKEKYQPFAVFLTAVLLEQLIWPCSSVPALLGPAFFWGLQPLLPLPRWLLYATAASISAIISIFIGSYSMLIIIPLHFLLWGISQCWRHRFMLVLSACLPTGLAILAGGKYSWSICLIGIASSLCQILLYHALHDISQEILQRERQRYCHLRAADRISIADAQWQTLQQLHNLSHELGKITEYTYTLYQDIEMLVRSNTAPAASSASQLLQASQQVHQLRLQLYDWQKQQENQLLHLAGRSETDLHTLCQWVAAQVQATAEQNQQVVTPITELADNPLLSIPLQLPLACMLLAVCRQGLQTMPAGHIYVRFNVYVVDTMRLIITLSPATDQPGEEWPELLPYHPPVLDYFPSQVTAHCQQGTTSSGEQIFILEVENTAD